MTVTLATTPELRVVRDYAANDQLQGFYLLSRIETRPKKNGELFLLVELMDSTGKLDGKMWENFEDAAAGLRAGDAVFADGRIDFFNKQQSVTLHTLRKASEQEVPDRRAFLPHSALSATQANERLMGWIESVQEPHLRALLDAIFDDPTLRGRFLDAPGGKSWHHATVGGLAEHTLSMVALADGIAGHYPLVHRDLLVTGTLLHDIGKTAELSWDLMLDYTSEGRLIGHITQGVLLVEDKLRGLAEFPAEMRRQLLHLILSHQGDGEKGSPVKPMTLEALALHYLDELDSRLNAFGQVRARTPEGQALSDYQRLMERYFYFRSPDEPTDEEGQ